MTACILVKIKRPLNAILITFLSSNSWLLTIFGFIIYINSRKSLFSCVLLVESISRESDEIRLSPSQQHERDTTRYRPANNKKKSRAPSREDATFGHA